MTVFEKNMLLLEEKLADKRANYYISHPEELEEFKIMVASSARRNDQLVLKRIEEINREEQEFQKNIKKLELRAV